jgi:hypothetical protein
VQLAILFWFYRDVAVCRNRLRLLRHRNPGVPIFGLYGGPLEDVAAFEDGTGGLLDDFWSFPVPADRQWKWRHGDMVLAQWFTDRGANLAWDSVFVAQWDLVVVSSLAKLVPDLAKGDMLISGLRSVREVESWWRWTNGPERREYDEFLAHVAARYGPVGEPKCCQFIGLVAPRDFLARYAQIDQPELGFLEYKVPIYAEVFGMRLVPDRCFRPWWPEDPSTTEVRRRVSLVHAWPTPVRLPVMLSEALRPGGRRVFHPYHGIYPHDVSSVADALRRRRTG